MICCLQCDFLGDESGASKGMHRSYSTYSTRCKMALYPVLRYPLSNRITIHDNAFNDKTLVISFHVHCSAYSEIQRLEEEEQDTFKMMKSPVSGSAAVPSVAGAILIHLSVSSSPYSLLVVLLLILPVPLSLSLPLSCRLSPSLTLSLSPRPSLVPSLLSMLFTPGDSASVTAALLSNLNPHGTTPPVHQSSVWAPVPPGSVRYQDQVLCQNLFSCYNDYCSS